MGQAMRVTNGPAMRRNGRIPWSILGVLMVVLSGCSRTDSESPTTLRLSMIPATDPGKIIRESKPFVEYLQRKVGAKVELTVPTNYYYCVINITSVFRNKTDSCGTVGRDTLRFEFVVWRWSVGYDAQRVRGEPRGWNSDGSFAVRSSSRSARAEGEKRLLSATRKP